MISKNQRLTNQSIHNILVQSARNNLMDFCIYTDEEYQNAHIHNVMADAFMGLHNGDYNKLILELPPRSGKSRMVCEYISMFIGQNPSKEVLFLGHTISLLRGFTKNIIRRLSSDAYKYLFPDTILDTKNKDRLGTTKGGKVSIFGVGGGPTGEGGDLIVIDDPYKSREDAMSPLTKVKVREWYKSTVTSRAKDDNTKVIVIMQRWAEDDLIGTILQSPEASSYHRVTVPALTPKKGKEKRDPLIWKPDDVTSYWGTQLDGSVKFSTEKLLEKRATMGAFNFNSQYQQSPTAVGAGNFTRDNFQYISIDELDKIGLEHFDIITFLDPAFSLKKKADFNGLVTIGVDKRNNHIYVLEVKRLKDKVQVITNEVFKTVRQWRNIGGSYIFGLETVGGQSVLDDFFQKQMKEENFHFKIVRVGKTGDKESRIQVMLELNYIQKRIFHPKWDRGIQELENELLKFPNAPHDDLIDSLSQCVRLGKVLEHKDRAIVGKKGKMNIINIGVNDLILT